MALTDNGHADFGVLSVACEGKRFPSVGQSHPPAIRLERAIRDLWGLEPEGLAGRAALARPRDVESSAASESRATRRAPERYAFLPAEGESLHQIPVGPVHAGIIEPGHFRFTANGEAVVRLEERLGYVHKGIEKLMAGMPIERAAMLAGRVSGDSTVAYALAFARAIEAALGIEVPRTRRVAARAHERARKTRQSLRRHRRDLQRCRVRHDACAMRVPARAGAARRGPMLRAPTDDGPSGARRGPTGSARAEGRNSSARCCSRFASAFRSWSSSTTTPLRCRIAP